MFCDSTIEVKNIEDHDRTKLPLQFSMNGLTNMIGLLGFV